MILKLLNEEAGRGSGARHTCTLKWHLSGTEWARARHFSSNTYLWRIGSDPRAITDFHVYSQSIMTDHEAARKRRVCPPTLPLSLRRARARGPRGGGKGGVKVAGDQVRPTHGRTHAHAYRHSCPPTHSLCHELANGVNVSVIVRT